MGTLPPRTPSSAHSTVLPLIFKPTTPMTSSSTPFLAVSPRVAKHVAMIRGLRSPGAMQSWSNERAGIPTYAADFGSLGHHLPLLLNELRSMMQKSMDASERASCGLCMRARFGAKRCHVGYD